MAAISRRQLFLLLVMQGTSNLCIAQTLEAEQLLRQQEREKELRQLNEAQTPAHLQSVLPALSRLPTKETPCQIVRKLVLRGEASEAFQWTIAVADQDEDPILGRCLGVKGIAMVMQRIQQAILERGYITTRVLAEPQDLSTGTLTFTLLPGRIRHIRFAEGTHARATLWNAIPAQPGDLLNLRELEQGLDNLKRTPSTEASIRIVSADDGTATPGQSDVIIEWRQTLPFRANFSIDDAGSKYTGKRQAALTLAYDHWLTLNDLLYLTVNEAVGGGLSGNRGAGSRTLHYAVPWKNWLLSVTATDFSYHQTVAGLNQDYRYLGEGNNRELGLTYLLARDSVSKTSASLRWWSRESRHFIDDAEINPQRRNTGGWELALGQRRRLGDASLDANIVLRRGTGAFGSQPAPEQRFGEGTSRMELLRTDAMLSAPFRLASQRLRYSTVWRAQWHRTPLTPPDRFAIGSRYTVRGFDGELFLSGDRGWLLRQELGIALTPIGAEFYAGIDTGKVGGQATAYLLGKQLTGAVVGVRSQAMHWSWDFFLGRPLHKPEGFRTAGTTAGFQLSLNF